MKKKEENRKEEFSKAYHTMLTAWATTKDEPFILEKDDGKERTD